MKLHTQTFDKSHENGCPIDLRPKQASYSTFKQNYDTFKNHSDGQLRTNVLTQISKISLQTIPSTLLHMYPMQKRRRK